MNRAPIRRLVAALAACICLCSGSALAEVTLTGVDDAVAANIRTYLLLDDEPCDAPRERIQQRYRGLEGKVREAVRPFGYYEPTITLALDLALECWRVDVKVELGDPIVVREIDIAVTGEAADDPVFMQAVPFSTLERGKRFQHPDYEAVKKAIGGAARTRGYFEGAFTEHRVTVSKADHAADIHLVYASGARFRFGEVFFETDALNAPLLARYAPFRAGEPYDEGQTLEFYQDLVGSGYFDSVQIDREPGDNAVVDLRVSLEPRKRWGFSAGLGYGTDTGAVISGEVLNRRVNQRGHRLRWETALSTVDQTTTVEYRLPGKRPATDWYSLFAGAQRKESAALQSEGWHGGGRQGKRLNSSWFETRFLEFTTERLLEDTNWRRQQSLVPGISWELRTGPVIPRPRYGFKSKLEIAGAAEGALSDTSFLRAHLTGKTILPFGSRARLLLRGEVGNLRADSFDAVPPSWRFYAGGDASVRGYNYQSLGPKDSKGEAIGGSHLLTGSAEMDFAVTDRWSGAVFADSGSVSVDSYGEEFSWTYGVGVRFYSPLGPFRVDFAFPQQSDDSFRLHISLGPDL